MQKIQATEPNERESEEKLDLQTRKIQLMYSPPDNNLTSSEDEWPPATYREKFYTV